MGNNDTGSLRNILDTLIGVFNNFRPPAKPVPPQVIMAGKNLKPGLSPRNLAANIISRFESEAGIPMGDVYADGGNIEAIKIKIICEEIIKMLQNDAKVDIVIDPGAIQIAGSGTSPSGPVVVKGANVTPSPGGGGIR